MRKLDEYLVTIDTIYPDGYAREHMFRDTGDMVEAQPFPEHAHGSLLRRLFPRFATWLHKRESRLSLRDLSQEQLRDIGLSRREALEELDKARILSRLTRSL